MDEQQSLVYIQSQIACAMIKAMGMQAENKQRETLGQSMAYTDADFFNLIEEHGIYHNAVLSQMFSR